MHPNRSFRRNSFQSLWILINLNFLISCSSSRAIEPEKISYDQQKETLDSINGNTSSYKGWDFLVAKLRSDGIAESAIASVFGDDRLPEISFIPFKLSPSETSLMYNRMTSPERLDRAEGFLEKHKDTFLAAENRFGVSKFIIAAIISVETNWGSYTGNEQVFYRLARVVSTGEPKNLTLNFRKMNLEDPTVSLEQTRSRSEYLFNTFYPNILALFHTFKNNPQDILNLKGSIAGAFGLPQFLPKSLEDYGTDGNKDETVDLFTPEDAIFSVANFLKQNGWRKLLSPQEKLAVLWHYNRSEAYGRAVIRVALSLQNRTLNLGL